MSNRMDFSWNENDGSSRSVSAINKRVFAYTYVCMYVHVCMFTRNVHYIEY